jgi:invasion protein IalB
VRVDGCCICDIIERAYVVGSWTTNCDNKNELEVCASIHDLLAFEGEIDMIE